MMMAMPIGVIAVLSGKRSMGDLEQFAAAGDVF
jgi:hypothetical protein